MRRKNRNASIRAQIAMIPAGPVPVIRMERDEIDIQPVLVSDGGRVMAMQQVVSTPIRKLLKQGAISAIEADAAGLLRSDHDAAYARGRSVLAAVQVDGGGSDDAHDRIMLHGDRYRRAMRSLCPELRRIAYIGVIEPATSIQATFQALGKTMVPNAGAPEQTGAGKAALVLTVRELAVFYGMRRA